MRNIFKRNNKTEEKTEYVEITVCDYYDKEYLTTKVFYKCDTVGIGNFITYCDEVRSIREFTK